MRENNSGFKIDESQRQSWLSIAAVWAGGMICVPCLMIGGVLAGGGLSLSQIVLSILIGYGLICVYMICIGMQACDTGLPVSVMASGALGEKGARYIISALLAIACVGWFGKLTFVLRAMESTVMKPKPLILQSWNGSVFTILRLLSPNSSRIIATFFIETPKGAKYIMRSLKAFVSP